MQSSPASGKYEARLEIDPRAAIAVRNGHPWVYRNALTKVPAGLPVGSAVSLYTRDGTFVARGLWDPESPIAVRIYTCRVEQHLDLPFLTFCVARALACRDRLFDTQVTNAFRLVYGEGDRIPGLVIDRYDYVAVARFDGDAIRSWATPLLEAIWPQLESRGIRSLIMRDGRGAPIITTVAGEPPPKSIVVREHAMNMAVDLLHGQKTGAFLDQRENRRRIRSMSEGLRILNLFSYTGGFSYAAALGGAAHVTSVDSAHPAHATAQDSFRLNNLDPTKHSFVTSDVFAFLEQARARNEHYDLVISDPPSFAPNERSLPRALSAYRRLHAACAAIVARNGIFCAASCSSHVTMDSFLSTLDDAVLEERNFLVHDMFGLPPDHPTTASWSEGRYLKFVVLRQTNLAAGSAQG